MSKSVARRLLVVAATVGVVGAGALVVSSWTTASSNASVGKTNPATAVPAPTPPLRLAARRLRQRPHAVSSGSVVSSSDVFTDRVFANARNGFALANDGEAQYPALSTDGGRRWRIDGPQQERASNADALKPFPNHTRCERGEIRRDVGEFRHAGRLHR